MFEDKLTDIEEMMKDLGCDAKYISSASIRSKIESVEFAKVVLCDHMFMYCGIKMKNGFVVTGKPATCISPENWRDEIGRKISFENAFQEIYRLEAYADADRTAS